MKTIGACFDIFTASVRYDVHFLLQSFLTESSCPALLSYSRLSHRTQPLNALLKAEPAPPVDVCGGIIMAEFGFTKGKSTQLKIKGQRGHFFSL